MWEVAIVSGSQKQIVQAEAGQNLGSLLHRHIPFFAMPCAGNHTCGKCRIKVSGTVSPMTDDEMRLLGDSAKDFRLACFCSVQGDLKITLDTQIKSKILSWYQIPPTETSLDGYGFAVDIGTTTVAMQLIHRPTGQIVAQRLAENSQRGFGADVISRIEACKDNGLQLLSDRIAEQLETMANECLAESSVKRIEESVITGNSTMLHIYERLDPASLAVSPFAVQSYFGRYSSRTLAGALVYLPRCVGAYVGADITCALLAADCLNGKTQLLADIGTNGEIALVKDGKILCCSTAAGPAFEGAGLSQGMSASAGAVCAVWDEEDAVRFNTIENYPAIGLCGSGALDALAVMLKKDAMDSSGYIEEGSWPIGNSGICLTQRDVRQIQLAKSAICAGILTLLEKESLLAEHIDRFIIAGGFGSFLNHDSATAIGLFPAALSSKSDFIGNGALGGAALLLCSRQLRDISAQMADKAEEIPLSASAEFMDYYIDCMSFEEF